MNNFKKKVLAMILSVCMVVSTATVVFATDSPVEGTTSLTPITPAQVEEKTTTDTGVHTTPLDFTDGEAKSGNGYTFEVDDQKGYTLTLTDFKMEILDKDKLVYGIDLPEADVTINLIGVNSIKVLGSSSGAVENIAIKQGRDTSKEEEMPSLANYGITLTGGGTLSAYGGSASSTRAGGAGLGIWTLGTLTIGNAILNTPLSDPNTGSIMCGSIQILKGSTIHSAYGILATYAFTMRGGDVQLAHRSRDESIPISTSGALTISGGKLAIDATNSFPVMVGGYPQISPSITITGGDISFKSPENIPAIMGVGMNKENVKVTGMNVTTVPAGGTLQSFDIADMGAGVTYGIGDITSMTNVCHEIRMTKTPSSGGGSSSGGSYNPPQPSQPTEVVVGTDGSTNVDFGDVGINESETSGDKTTIKTEIAIDETVTDKATKQNPIDIKMELSTEEIKKSIEATWTNEIHVDLVVPNAVATNEHVSIAEIMVGKEVFESVKANDKSVTFEVKTQKGDVIATWNFDGASIKTAVDVNLAVNLMKPTTAMEQAGAKTLQAPVVVSFGHSGSLPTKATVSVDVSKTYADGDNLYLYYFNETTKQLEYVGKDHLVTNGTVAIQIEHCSDYLLSKTQTNGAITPTTPPATGVTNHATSAGLFVMAIICCASLALCKKIKK